MKDDRLSSPAVGLLRLPLTVFVVFNHYNMGVRGFSIHGETYGLDAPEWFRWVPAGASFRVFALHTLVMDDVGKVLFTALRLTPDIPALLALYFCVPLLTVVLCLTVYFVLRRLAPSLCALLTGGR